MKTFNPKSSKTFIACLSSFLLISFSTVFASNPVLISEKSISTLDNSKFGNCPDTIPSIEDTVKAVAVYNVTDTAAILIDGLDMIVFLQEDTTIYFAQEDSAIQYLIGDLDTSILFNKPIDSNAYYYATDTAEYFIPAEDSLAYQLIRTDFEGEERNSMNLILESTLNIINVNLTDNTKAINSNLFGIHIPGIFLPDHTAEQDLNHLVAWDALKMLKPSSLRFPGGADTRWMHPVPYDKDWDCDLDPVKGYGYNIYEIIKFFDVSDDNDDVTADIEADDPLFVASILTDMNDPLDGAPDETPTKPIYICNNCSTWMDLKYVDEFESLYSKWIDQEAQSLNPLDPNFAFPAIEQFLHLVDYIEDYWHTSDPTYKIDVIIDLSIPSMSATECKRMVNYLRNGDPVAEGGNGVTSVNVTGVEMGNEVFYEWGILMMGFETFADYWNYINGSMPDLTWADLYYDYIYGPGTDDLPCVEAWDDKTYGDHNYLRAMKLQTTPAPKVGIPVIVELTDDAWGLTGPGTETVTECPSCKLADGWETVSDYYDDKFLLTNTYKFDAIILHPYYAPTEDNWMGIPLHYLCTTYPSSGPPSCIPSSCSIFEDDKWQDDVYDPRLRAVFDAMIGYPVLDVASMEMQRQSGNLYDFLKTRYLDTYISMNEVLKFDITGPTKKELWETEKNLKNQNNAATYSATLDDPYDPITLTPALRNLWTIYDNTFVHGYLLQEWFLKDLKINFNTNFREGFFTYAHLHSLGAGGWEKLLVDTDCGDDNYLENLSPPIYTGGEAYYMRRTTYWSYLLLSEIVKEKLKYIKSNFTIPAKKNINQPPTMFISPDNKYVYGYYSNASETSENIVVNPNTLINLFPGATHINLLNPRIYMVDAAYPNSSSGKNSLVTSNGGSPRINSCYGCQNVDDPGTFHTVDITGITEQWNVPECTTLPAGSLCVTLPGYSYGYFKSEIEVSYIPDEERLAFYPNAVVNLFPNPTSDYFIVDVQMAEIVYEKIHITVNDLTGHIYSEYEISNGDVVNISELPSGIYQVTIQLANSQKILKSLVKI